ncbi:CheR family methyltransferase [Chamaesiphon sp. OTE_8_metabat_110]|uniref:CheR family methyltransferase n=1 Tax=Chamaesiphon sp. OTE_8_metabat_110 TaxID=2964696 RepID=UPI00286BC020|nr:CheR family methyltransferase [Chamaesiphon sp. OTE_8_metabat_110]
MLDRESSKQSPSESPGVGREPSPKENRASFPTALVARFAIVGVGASAGGLDAFKQLLRHLAIDTGMAFVLIQHLAPEHQSLLAELLGRTTAMPVCEVTEGMEIAPDRVYIIPPNTTMKLVGRVFHLSPRERTASGYMPADRFFESLAAGCGSRGIGVVLSGVDGDGSVGLAAIKAAGGITFAQDLPSAQFDGMPEHAAQTGRVDFILPPQAIAAKLNEIGRQWQLEPGSSIDLPPPSAREPSAPDEQPVLTASAAPVDPLSQIFELLRQHTGVNFALYKQATIQRRVQRRMSQHAVTRLEDYLTCLDGNAAELTALYQDFLIDVTSFFRDPEVFQSLTASILPQIAQQHSQSPIRIWVAGCATGEEAYSIAICLLEVLEGVVPQPAIQIFATDLNIQAIETARVGIYPQSAVAHISPERLRRFFVPSGDNHQVSKSVRELCIFARHNLCSDPPFSRMDLISCRNVLIYFEATLQKRVMQNLHYALNPNGCLLLGTSETATATELFTQVDKQHKIYAKKLALVLPSLDLPLLNELTQTTSYQHPPSTRPATELQLTQLADDLVLQRYAPAGLIVNTNLDILEFRGNTSAYLQPAPGKSSLKVMKMVQAGLRAELRTAIQQAKQLDRSIERIVECHLQNSQLNANINAGSTAVRLEVIPLRVPSAADGYLLILFETIAPQQISTTAPAQRKAKQTLVELENTKLKQELAAMQAQMQLMIDEQEAATQDFRAASEEILSSNEELQSTNEELETAKEEIQGANEELMTVNEELRSRDRESTQLNNDLVNILSSIQLPILIVGTDLRIGRFTPMAEPLFNLIAADIGRSFSNMRHNLDLPDLDRQILQTIDTLTIYQQEIQDLAGHWYHLTIRPYKTVENQIVGATLVLADVDTLKRHQQEIQAARDYAAAIVETVQYPLVVLDGDLRVVSANGAFYRMFQLDPPQVEGQEIDTLADGCWQIPGLRSRLEALRQEQMPFQDVEIEYRCDPTDTKTLLFNGWQVLNTGDWQLFLLAISDITERKQIEAHRTLLAQEQAARATAEAASLAKDNFLSMLSHELRNPLSAIVGWAQMILSGKLSPAQVQRGLEVIDRSASAQNQLIEDLIDISRINNQQLRIDIEPIDPIPVIAAAIDTLTIAAADKNIRLERQLDPFPSRVLGDASRIEQILLNLLSNAIKFTASGGKVIVRLSLVPISPANPIAYAQLQIIDNGKGISPEFLPYIFDRFRQADSCSTKMENGLGLGLAIVHHLVKLHGGQISVTSQLGEGSTFTVQLPLAPDLPPDTPVLPAAAAPLLAGDDAKLLAPTTRFRKAEATPTTPSLTGATILVVDDEPDVLTLITTILQQAGATVTAVGSANAAIQTLQAQPQAYDLLLSDLGMPDTDGWTLIRQIRTWSAEAGGEIPAAALTAYNTIRDRRISHAFGFQILLSKPIQPAQLVADVAKLVHKPA